MRMLPVLLAMCLLGCASSWGDAVTNRPSRWAAPLQVEGVPNLHRVSDTLYRSAQPTAAGMQALKKMGVKTVVNLRAFHSDADELRGTGLAGEHIPMKAWDPELQEAVLFLQIVTDPARQPVLVHCQQGADRTGAMCAVYRIAVQGWSKEEALREMREGGYGFHEVWEKIPAWIGDLKVEDLTRPRPAK